jgi:hypothetical protein
MITTKPFAAFLLVLGFSLAAGPPLAAQDFDTQTPVVDVRADDSQYTSSTYTAPPAYEPNPRFIVQQNAQTRAQQRQLRLSSMAWYGMSNSRPTASPTPFASRYSPVWEMPGGRPYAWFTFNRPTYLIYR